MGTWLKLYIMKAEGFLYTGQVEERVEGHFFFFLTLLETERPVMMEGEPAGGIYLCFPLLIGQGKTEQRARGNPLEDSAQAGAGWLPVGSCNSHLRSSCHQRESFLF